MWVGRTPGHIPRYMSQTSNNNNRYLYQIPVLIPVTLAMQVMISDMIPIRMTVMTPVSDSSYDPYYDSYYGPLIIIVMYSCLDFHMICNSDSIRLDIRWHEIKVYR